MSSVAEGVSKHISRECGVNPNRKASFLNMHKILGLISASCLRGLTPALGLDRRAPRGAAAPGRLRRDRAPPNGGRCNARPASFCQEDFWNPAPKLGAKEKGGSAPSFHPFPTLLLQISLGRSKGKKQTRFLGEARQGGL